VAVPGHVAAWCSLLQLCVGAVSCRGHSAKGTLQVHTQQHDALFCGGVVQQRTMAERFQQSALKGTLQGAVLKAALNSA
jgi:hypothetical protein